jgi:hypothetical protein
MYSPMRKSRVNVCLLGLRPHPRAFGYPRALVSASRTRDLFSPRSAAESRSRRRGDSEVLSQSLVACLPRSTDFKLRLELRQFLPHGVGVGVFRIDFQGPFQVLAGKRRLFGFRICQTEVVVILGAVRFFILCG